MADFDFDLFVIGGGSGGVRAARFAGQRGVRVGMAESGRMGGTCVNVGCIPKKLYSYAAEYAEGFADARGYGWNIPGEPALDWDTLKRNRAQSIANLNAIYENLMTGAKVDRMQGHASLVDAHTVQVRHDDGRVTQHSAAAILIATGGTPWVPELPGRELAVTSDDIFDLPRFPRRLAVVGGGYIACEFASIFHGMGSTVTLLYRGEQVLRGFDGEVRNFAAEEMRKAGVDIRVRAGVERIEAVDGARRMHLRDGTTLDADVVLYATGRRANTEGLGLDAAGVRQSEGGTIAVDAHFATSVPGIYALGDVVGRMELTPVALAEAMALVDHLYGPLPGKPARAMDYANIPTAVFTHPPIGTVGLSEEAAREKHGAVRIYRSDFRPLRHSLSGRSERTMVKLIVEDATDRVVGAHMVGAEAGEIIQGFAVALKCGATKAQFDATIGIHPTSAEEFVTLREVART
ncbi:glutathione-disulfide reductase [Comamonas badia]|uniref:glutathione-disulfide reductase n=1 Tax=Comamonas badia TaxID=265291 RepID=UPI000429673B|nr:glutathione-disulfide reductase [Comamonas badia]